MITLSFQPKREIFNFSCFSTVSFIILWKSFVKAIFILNGSYKFSLYPFCRYKYDMYICYSTVRNYLANNFIVCAPSLSSQRQNKTKRTGQEPHVIFTPNNLWLFVFHLSSWAMHVWECCCFWTSSLFLFFLIKYFMIFIIHKRFGINYYYCFYVIKLYCTLRKDTSCYSCTLKHPGTEGEHIYIYIQKQKKWKTNEYHNKRTVYKCDYNPFDCVFGK